MAESAPTITRLDVVLAVGAAGSLLVDAELSEDGTGITVAGVLLAVVVAAALTVRARAPLAVLAVVTAASIGCLLLMHSTTTAIVPTALALYAAARHGRRTRSVVIAAVVVPVIVVAVVLVAVDEVPVWALLTNPAIAAAALALGDAVRSRANYRAAVEDRIAGLERARMLEGERRAAEERLRIAADLHDLVAHAMIGINVQAGVAAHISRRHPEQAQEALLDIKRASADALAELRQTLGLLREDGDLPFGAGRALALAALAAPLERSGIAVTKLLDEPLDGIPPLVGVAAYRIVQESMTNVLRHGAATWTELRAEVSDGALHIDVSNDVHAGAAELAATGTGSGVRAMAERAASVGGTLTAGRDGAAWRVRVVLPLART